MSIAFYLGCSFYETKIYIHKIPQPSVTANIFCIDH